ncbi:hypothetical protein EGW08_012342 [Elysia chlorotica]|uniref:Uncharacterized protein n=1 Tax=Elysia chlorotica TaxID=188477 RepID=A0A3S1C0W0_ELYCH|nr:hypothetical protein EGW08_012342 [Elysia chlorotica]
MAHLLPAAGTRTIKNESFMFNRVCRTNYFPRDSPPSSIPPNIHDYKWTDYKELERRCKAHDAALAAEEYERANSVIIPRTHYNPAGTCPANVYEQFAPPSAYQKHQGAGYGASYGTAGGHVEGQCRGNKGNKCGVSHGSHNSRGSCARAGGFRGAGQGDGVGVHGDGGGCCSFKPMAYAGRQHHHKAPGCWKAHMANNEWGYCPPVGIDPKCLIRPRNKSLHTHIRPTGEPYFTQESKSTCPEPQGPPSFHPNCFNFDQWLQTEEQRKPPAALRNACIQSNHQHCRSAVNQPPNTYAYAFVPYHYGYGNC